MSSSRDNLDDQVALRATPLSDLQAHDHAMSIPIGQVVRELVDLLGATHVAVIGGVSDTHAVHQWMTGREPQRAQILRFALQIAAMIAAKDDRELARAWFQGSNPHLGDQIPLFMLRDSSLIQVHGPMMAAARAFATRTGLL